MLTTTIDIEAPDGVADAYVARPDEESRPGVLLIMDAYGVRPAVERIADRIASDGYVVMAPNVFYRGGRAAPILSADEIAGENAFEKIRPLMAELTPERIEADGAAYLEALAEVAAPGRVVVTGYCMGGRVGWWLAAAYPDRVAAVAAFHTGGLVTDGDDSPHAAAERLDGVELLFGFADEDRNMTPEQIATLERALDDAGVPYRSELYDGALHGYTMDDLPVFDEAARERHFRELHSLLERMSR
jgi:carboxymethylenebutenolidase